MNGENTKRRDEVQNWDSLRAPNTPEVEPITDRDSKKLGEAMMHADEMAEGTSYDMSERRHFTIEEIKNYRNDAYPRNIEFLERVGADRSLKKSYREMMSEYPFLRSVVLDKIRSDKPGVPDREVQNASSCYAYNTNEGVRQAVLFNFDNPDIYLTKMHNEKGDMNGFYTVIVEIALRVGARPSEIAKNRALVSTFVMAHEFGHAMDFQQNFIAPEIVKARNAGHKKGVGAIALPEALAAQKEARSADMASMLTGRITTDSRTETSDIIRARYMDLDLRTPEEREIYNKKSYRKCRSENYADTFAMNFVMRHYDRFFYDPRKGESANGRVATNLYGETKTINKEILPLLDFHAGKHVSAMILGDDGKARKMDGYLGQSLRFDEAMSLNLSGDPADHRSGNVQQLGKIRNIRIKQEKGPHGAINTFYLIMDNFSTIELKVSGNGEAPDVDVDPSDFLQRYRMSEGSQLSLLKRRVKNGEFSAVSTGGLLFGRLARNRHGGRPIEKGSSIYLDADKQSGATGGNTSNVKRFYRRWKRYYVETETSTYELLPYLPDRSKH